MDGGFSLPSRTPRSVGAVPCRKPSWPAATARTITTRIATTHQMTSHLMMNMSELLFPDQADKRDLRRDPETHRRSPKPRAAASVNPHAAEAVQPRDERLLQAHEEVPRPELAAMRVPGELQLVAGGFRGIRGARLVREQDLRRVLRRAFRRRSTIAATKFRLIVCPTWMSLICAMVKPSSSLGRPASGTSTSTTGAVRRAIKKPMSVIAGVSAMTPIAEMRIQDSWACEDGARADAIRLRSRKMVRTNRYEKKPIVSHGSITAQGPRSSRIRNPLGKSQKHTASTAPPASCVIAPNGKRSRTPI